MKNIFYYLTPALIWGSTWLVIKFQLGVVDPMVSVVYRFAAAGIILGLFCLLRRLPLKFTLKDHLFMAAQGLLLFGVNYWMVYFSEQYLTSGLVALMFSTIAFLNIFYERLFLKVPMQTSMLTGAFIGFTGVALVFRPEIAALTLSNKIIVGILIAFIAANLASLGNITSAHNQKNRLPVIQTNAFAMSYGAASMLLVALITRTPFALDTSTAYMISLSYLAVFGSIIAFGAYLTLIGRIGAGKAAYVALVIPVIALIFSTIFEGFRWSVYSFAGLGLILIGNLLVILTRQKKIKS